MDTPTAEEIRTKMPSIEWEALGVTTDEQLNELLLDATDQVAIVTGWDLSRVPTSYERTMDRALGMMAAWLASRASTDVVETAGDWDLIASLSAGSYSETRRGGKDALWALTLVNPWPPLAGLLWNLMLPTSPPPGDPAVAARLEYWTELASDGKEHAPYWETTEVDWSGLGTGLYQPGTWDWAGGRY